MFLHTVTVMGSLWMNSGGHCLITTLHILARLGGWALGAPGIQCHRDNERLCSDTTGWPAAVGAASQAVPIRAALCASTTTVLVVGHWILQQNREHMRLKGNLTIIQLLDWSEFISLGELVCFIFLV